MQPGKKTALGWTFSQFGGRATVLSRVEAEVGWQPGRRPFDGKPSLSADAAIENSPSGRVFCDQTGANFADDSILSAFEQFYRNHDARHEGFFP